MTMNFGNFNSKTVRARRLLTLSLLASIVSAFYSPIAFLPAQELGIATSDNSDYRDTVVWGAPLRFVVDMLNSRSLGQIDGKDDFSSATFLVSWLIWLVNLSCYLHSRCHSERSEGRTQSRDERS